MDCHYFSKILRFSFTLGIKYMFAEPTGTKIAFIDTKNQGYIYSPVTDALILVREIPAR